MDELLIKPKRKLGTGRYDKKLIERMIDLSVAENYEDAAKEWIATGNVYWGDIEVPDWWEDRKGSCLCGHRVVYHFEVENTENGEMILVGSDHINSYHILKQIALSTGMQESMITDEMIDEWMKVRVASMMQTAWWHNNGDMFTKMFDAVKEYDVRVNVRVLKWEYNGNYMRNMPVTAIRKAGKGSVTDSDYKMASIVWRWNHPDNPKAQVNTRGYPTDKLWNDLIMFYCRIQEFREQCETEDERNAHLLKNAERYKMLRNISLDMIEEDKARIERSIFDSNCEYYGIENFYNFDSSGLDNWSQAFLRDMKKKLVHGYYDPTGHQLKKLGEILQGNTPATPKQIRYLLRLGYKGEVEGLGKMEASKLITELVASGAKPEY